MNGERWPRATDHASIAWAVEGNDAWDPWDIKPRKMKPDHTPPEPAVLDRVAKSIANMK